MDTCQVRTWVLVVNSRCALRISGTVVLHSTNCWCWMLTRTPLTVGNNVEMLSNVGPAKAAEVARKSRRCLLNPPRWAKISDFERFWAILSGFERGLSWTWTKFSVSKSQRPRSRSYVDGDVRKWVRSPLTVDNMLDICSATNCWRNMFHSSRDP